VRRWLLLADSGAPTSALYVAATSISAAATTTTTATSPSAVTPMPASIAVEAIATLAAVPPVSAIASRLVCAVPWTRDAGACRGIATTTAGTASVASVAPIAFVVVPTKGLRT
jgi:hypothetical protein